MLSHTPSMDLSDSKTVIGRLLPNNPFFNEGDRVCNVYKRLGVFDVDSEELCHKEINNLLCEVPGCGSTLNSVMELELHYNSVHRYTCASCHKSFASAHLLDLHLEETHDSYFAVQAERKPMYRCLIENCNEKFTTSQERHCHCVDNHAFPTNFRWITPKVKKPKFNKSKACKEKVDEGSSVKKNEVATEFSASMDVDDGTDLKKEAAGRKPIHGFSFGRGCFKKTFNTKSVDWHQKHKNPSKASALDGSQLSEDLMNSLQNEEMS